MRTLPFVGLLLGSFVSAASAQPLAQPSAQPSAGPAELTDRQMDRVTAGAGKVSMQDFHFVMKQNSSSPRLEQNSFVMKKDKASPRL